MRASPWTVVRGVPGVRLVRSYRRADLGADVTAGLVMTAVAVPYGMAYAELAGVPAVTGLYTTIVALLTYALVGPSRSLLLGPDSSLAPLIAAAIALVVVDGDPGEAIAVAGVLSLITGLLCVLAGVTRLGTVAELLSRPVQLGYLNGLAIVMVISQLAKLAGFSVDADMPIPQLGEFLEGVADGLVNRTTLVLGLVVLLVMLGLDRLAGGAVGVLVGVLVAILAVELLDLTDRDVAVTGELPQGFPAPALPTVPIDTVPSLALAALGLAWVTLTDTTALSRGFAGRTGQRVDPNHEIMALGAANLATGWFQGFPVSGSSSRTSIAAASGGRTQLVGVVGAVLILALVVFGGGVVESLPSTALAAVVIAAAVALFDARGLRRLARVRSSELVLSLVATVGVVVLGVLIGILIAVALSLGEFVRRMWRPYDAVLGRVEQRAGYHDLRRHPEARLVPGLVLFRFDAPLFFANADHFRRRVDDVLAEFSGVRRLVVAAEPITDVDTSAAAMLEQLVAELHERGIELGFAAMKGPVKDRLRRYGLYERIGDEHFYSTVGSAADHFIADFDIDFVDWTER